MNEIASAPTLRAWPIDDTDGAVEVRPAPAVNLGFREARSFVVAAPVGPGCSLHVDDEPLERDSESPAAWTWSPGFYAGEVTAELRGADGVTLAHYLLDVSPDPAKAGREAFATMLEEIWEEDPALVIGSEPATRRIGSLGDEQDPLLELSRLRRHAPAFLRALDVIRARPRRSLVCRRGIAALRRVRRVDRRTAVAAARDPDLVSFLAGSQDPTARAADLRLDVPRVEETLDCAANRCLLALIGGVARRASSLLQRLQLAVDRESSSTGTRSPLATRWPARRRFLEDVLSTLARTRQRHPFSAVRRAEVTASGLNAVAADPLYARAWATGWKALRSGLEGLATDERMWISPTWEVYERWCFVTLGRLLREALPQLTWERLSGSATRGKAAWRGTAGATCVQLLLQPVFRSGGTSKRTGFWSVSREREPDLVITVDEAGMSRFVVLDAKYRRTRGNVLDAMGAAHTYQDSLRLGDRRADATLLLVPAGGGAPWLEEPAFQDQHRVGVVTLGAESADRLPRLLRSALGTAPLRP